MYSIEPLPCPSEFIDMWNAAGNHLNSNIHETGARWLRAELPAFREHLSFTLGNQLFFIQVLNIDGGEQSWVNLKLLAQVAKEANGIACVMPIRKVDGIWRPTEKSWGLVDIASDLPVFPKKLQSALPVIISDWEVHDIGIQLVRDYLKDEEYEIQSWQSDIRVNPSISCIKNGIQYAVVVRTSRKGPDAAVRPENAQDIALFFKERSIIPLFVGLKIASENDLFDPSFEHLTKKIFRGERILSSPVELRQLVLN